MVQFHPVPTPEETCDNTVWRAVADAEVPFTLNKLMRPCLIRAGRTNAPLPHHTVRSIRKQLPCRIA